MSDDVTIEVRRLAGRTWIAPLGTRTQPPSIEWVRLDANGERADPVNPWDARLDVDPFTGEPDHEHGDSCEDCE